MRFNAEEDRQLKRLWGTAVSDKALEDLFGRSRGSIRRRAHYLGLAPRYVARAAGIEAILKQAMLALTRRGGSRETKENGNGEGEGA